VVGATVGTEGTVVPAGAVVAAAEEAVVAAGLVVAAGVEPVVTAAAVVAAAPVVGATALAVRISSTAKRIRVIWGVVNFISLYLT
jgi:hypothetical protein